MDEHEQDGAGQNDLDGPGGIRKALEKANQRAAELEATNARLMRDLLFTEVGVPNKGMGSYFRKGYEGELTPEAVKAAAEEAGLLKSAESTEEPQVPADELAAHEVIRQSQTGGQLPGAQPQDDLIARIEAANSPEELAQIMAQAQR